jgi:hypothetical protein
MKKTILLIASVVLLAAACNSQTPTNTSNPTQSNNQTNPTENESNITLKTYKNDQLGFSIQYPTDWQVDESYDTEITFAPKNGSIEDNYVGVSVENYSLQTARSNHEKNGPKSLEKEINFAGVKAYEYTFTDTQFKNTYQIFIEYNGKLYLIQTQRHDLEQVKETIQSFQFVK